VGDLNIFHHLGSDLQLRMLRLITQKLESIMTTQAELAAQLLQVRDQITKVQTEITGKIADLEAAIGAAGTVSPEVEAALQAVRDALQPIDDIVPDA